MLYLNEEAIAYQIAKCTAEAKKTGLWRCNVCNMVVRQLCPLAIERRAMQTERKVGKPRGRSGGRKPDGKPKVTISLRIDPDLLAAIDRQVADGGAENRSRWMEMAARVRLTLGSQEPTQQTHRI